MSGKRNWTRRRFLKTMLGAGAAAAVGTPLYSFLYERTKWTVTSSPIRLAEHGRPLAGLRIVHLSDLHYGFFLDEEDARTVADEVARLCPDMICFTGDIVDGGIDTLERLIPLFASMEAPYGKFAVLGNHDYGTLAEERKVRAFWTESGFRCLANEHRIVDGKGGRFAVAGIEDALIGAPDLGAALAGIPYEMPVLLLAHEPDMADQAVRHANVALQLSGHSHGGQIRLPFVGALITPPLGRKYVSGLHSLNQGRCMLYTSRGLGTTQLPFRFHCPPEIALLVLEA